MKIETKHRIRKFLIFFLPLLVSIVVSSITCIYLKCSKYVIDVANILEAVKMVIGIWGTIFGFVFAGESILIAFNGSKLTEEVKNTGHYKTVLFTYMLTCFELLLCLVIFIPVVIANSFNILWMWIFIISMITTFIDMLLCLLFLSLVIKTAYQ